MQDAEVQSNEPHNPAPWWVMHDDTIRGALQSVEDGTPAEVAYVELQATVNRKLAPADDLYEHAYAVWMAFLAGTSEEMTATLQSLSSFMYEQEEAK